MPPDQSARTKRKKHIEGQSAVPGATTTSPHVCDIVLRKSGVNASFRTNTTSKKTGKTRKTVTHYFRPTASAPKFSCKVVNVKVKYIRPAFQNLRKWCEEPNNVYIGRSGVVFVPSESDSTRKERYPKRNSIWANPFKVITLAL